MKKIIIVTGLLAITAVVVSRTSLETDKDYVSLFKQKMHDLVEKMDISEQEVADAISPDFHQWVDGKNVDRDAFVSHILELKKHMVTAKVDFKAVFANKNVVSSIHEVHVTKSDGKTSVIKVMGHNTFNGDKLARVDELTFLLSGNAEDQKLGSIKPDHF